MKIVIILFIWFVLGIVGSLLMCFGEGDGGSSMTKKEKIAIGLCTLLGPAWLIYVLPPLISWWLEEDG